MEFTKQKHVEGKETNIERSWSSITCSFELLFGTYLGIGRIERASGHDRIRKGRGFQPGRGMFFLAMAFGIWTMLEMTISR